MLGQIKKMCTPAMIYFLISVFTLLVMIISNIGNQGSFCMGNYDCPIDNIYLIYIIKAIYLLFVTIVLDSLCKNGYTNISWFLLFLPIIFYFVVLGGFMIMKRSSVLVIEEPFEY
ncbi:MAG: hypothetical protein CMJ05_07750 [Pelagibacterales bacterium]|nr:hypothetical protein [Pelagibacterales bacterium]|tara:strand:- start:509 stop:853 length:345 start_codon:yes stop_codon:yes gene_type:complete